VTEFAEGFVGSDAGEFCDSGGGRFAAASTGQGEQQCRLAIAEVLADRLAGDHGVAEGVEQRLRPWISRYCTCSAGRLRRVAEWSMTSSWMSAVACSVSIAAAAAMAASASAPDVARLPHERKLARIPAIDG
jgi:hypothetical protein